MNRQQRSQSRRKRRRMMTFSLSLCLVIFLSGVYITNRVMMEVTSLPGEDSPFFLREVGQTLGKTLEGMQNKFLTLDIYDRGMQAFEHLIKVVSELIGRI